MSNPTPDSSTLDHLVRAFVDHNPEPVRAMGAALHKHYGVEWPPERVAVLCSYFTTLSRLGVIVQGAAAADATTEVFLRQLAFEARAALGEWAPLVERDVLVLTDRFNAAFVPLAATVDLRAVLAPMCEQLCSGTLWLSPTQIAAARRGLMTHYPQVTWDAFHMGVLFMVLAIQCGNSDFDALGGPGYTAGIEALAAELFGADPLREMAREVPAILDNLSDAPVTSH